MSQYASLCSNFEDNINRASVDEIPQITKIFIDIVYNILDYSFDDIIQMIRCSDKVIDTLKIAALEHEVEKFYSTEVQY